MILLFLDDLEKLDAIIRSELEVISFENAATRLDAAQFGYQSNHYVVRIPDAWRNVPNYSDLGSLKAELQVRTLAQHIWAASSHKLQYKREEGVPPPVRRTIHRVSALLETVDLEFSRVLAERTNYVETAITSDEDDEKLNVDLLSQILKSNLPPENLAEHEDYDKLLQECEVLGITTAKQLTDIIRRHLNISLDEDQRIVKDLENLGVVNDRNEERAARGVYFSLCGLAREALRQEFGEATSQLFVEEA